MIYRNGAKTYFIMFAICAVMYGGMMGLLYLDLIRGIIMGVLFGALFTAAMFVFSKVMERKFNKMRAEISENRHIVCDGAATVTGNGGWLFLTDTALEFYPHKINFDRSGILIQLADIRNVCCKGNKLIINTVRDTDDVPFVVVKNKEWMKNINQTIEKLKEQG
ncbi:MAG: hypothetical protein IJY08_04090 [Clostridia bacterium]|nr:hypothetical protein [Clostridia bacterium]